MDWIPISKYLAACMMVVGTARIAWLMLSYLEKIDADLTDLRQWLESIDEDEGGHKK